MADWLDYEKLAAKIYQDLNPYAEVKHNDKIFGYKSQTLRQIDVSIRTSIAGHELLIIVQAKNHQRPLDINAVGEFQSVIEDVRAQKGIMICNAGFTDKAINMARTESIDLCTLHDTQSPKWGLKLMIPLLWVEFSFDMQLNAVFVAERGNPVDIRLPLNPTHWAFSDNAGRAIPNIMTEFLTALRERTVAWVPNKPHKHPIIKAPVRIRFEPDYWMGVKSLNADLVVTARGWVGQINISDCRGIHNKINNTVTARLRIDSKDLPLTRNTDWKEVSDIEKFELQTQNILIVEKWPSDIGNLKLQYSTTPNKEQRTAT